MTVHVCREFGDLVFQANEPGEHHVYYMPFALQGRAFPTTVYDEPEGEVAYCYYVEVFQLFRFNLHAVDFHLGHEALVFDCPSPLAVLLDYYLAAFDPLALYLQVRVVGFSDDE